MKRGAYGILAVMLTVPTAFAQEQQAAPPAQPQAQAAAPEAQNARTPQPAPKKGHPLDWRDVEILTGKADRAARHPYAAGSPYVYVDPPVSGSRYSDSLWTPSSTRTTPFFVPRLFGRVSGRNSLVFGATSGFRGFVFHTSRALRHRFVVAR